MKKIGMVGGVSWLSTIEYYKVICELSHQHQVEREPEGPPAVPEMVIESLNINKSFNMRGTPGSESSWAGFDGYFNAALKRLEDAGAQVAFIASNTPHNRFDSITKGISIPVLNIFDVVASYCAQLELKKTLILGTAPTMASTVFINSLANKGIDGFVPTSREDTAATIKIIDELQTGDVEHKASEIETIVDNNAEQFSGQPLAVCLSCTELPLAYPDNLAAPKYEVNDILFLNTTVIHAFSVFEKASGQQLTF